MPAIHTDGLAGVGLDNLRFVHQVDVPHLPIQAPKCIRGAVKVLVEILDLQKQERVIDTQTKKG